MIGVEHIEKVALSRRHLLGFTETSNRSAHKVRDKGALVLVLYITIDIHSMTSFGGHFKVRDSMLSEVSAKEDFKHVGSGYVQLSLYSVEARCSFPHCYH